MSDRRSHAQAFEASQGFAEIHAAVMKISLNRADFACPVRPDVSPAATLEPRIGRGLGGLLRAILRAIARPSRRDAAIRDAASLSDHVLRDIGIHRSGLPIGAFGTVPYWVGRKARD